MSFAVLLICLSAFLPFPKYNVGKNQKNPKKGLWIVLSHDFSKEEDCRLVFWHIEGHRKVQSSSIIHKREREISSAILSTGTNTFKMDT